MKVSDYVMQFVANLGVQQVYVVQGGAVAHLIDSTSKIAGLDYICAAHEQAGAIAAYGAAARENGFGCAIGTTGPGVINLINGIACLYYDSLPSLFLGGQVTSGRNIADSLGVRQHGFQESPHAAMCAHVTKYSNSIKHKEDVRYELEKAVYIARLGRPGPVFLDICDDVQRADVNPDELKSFAPTDLETHLREQQVDEATLDGQIQNILELLSQAERPVCVFGYGVHLSASAQKARDLIERLGVPVLLTWGALDLIPRDHPLNAGGFGVHSPRSGNFTMQNSDFVMCVGARLSQHQTGTPTAGFARNAKRVVVDIDANELAKFEKIGWPVDVAVRADAKRFTMRLLQKSNNIQLRDMSDWLSKVREWRDRYGRVVDPNPKQDVIGPYACMDALCEATPEDSDVFGDVGATLSWMYQAFRAKSGQRLLTSLNNHTMGFALPAALGAALADPSRKAVSLNGDGGFLMNIQELGTVVRHQANVAIFVLNNQGYGVIQQTQEDYFGSRYNGVTAATGLSNPNITKIAEGFGLEARRISSPAELKDAIAWAMDHKGPRLLEIEIDPTGRIQPAVKMQRPIEDTAPFLSREELLENMLVAPMAVSLEQ